MTEGAQQVNGVKTFNSQVQASGGLITNAITSVNSGDDLLVEASGAEKFNYQQ
jgi:hypothetical protein